MLNLIVMRTSFLNDSTSTVGVSLYQFNLPGSGDLPNSHLDQVLVSPENNTYIFSVISEQLGTRLIILRAAINDATSNLLSSEQFTDNTLIPGKALYIGGVKILDKDSLTFVLACSG